MGDGAAVEDGRRRGTGERHGDTASGTHAEAAEEHLEGRAAAVVPDQPRPEPVGPAVGGAGATDPHGGQARASVVLDEDQRAGGQHLECGAHGASAASTNRTVVPGAEQGGRIALGVPQRDPGGADELPAAR